MSQPQVVTFPLKRVRALLDKVRAAARPTEIEIDHGLRVHVLDAMKLVDACSPHLRVRPGWALITQQYGDGANATGFTWALPADSPRPDQFLNDWPAVMDAVEAYLHPHDPTRPPRFLPGRPTTRRGQPTDLRMVTVEVRSKPFRVFFCYRPARQDFEIVQVLHPHTQ